LKNLIDRTHTMVLNAPSGVPANAGILLESNLHTCRSVVYQRWWLKMLGFVCIVGCLGLCRCTCVVVNVDAYEAGWVNDWYGSAADEGLYIIFRRSCLYNSRFFSCNLLSSRRRLITHWVPCMLFIVNVKILSLFFFCHL